MYTGVPKTSPDMVILSSGRLFSTMRARPKSSTFTCSPSGVSITTMFSGLRSRCMMPMLWAAAMASAIWTDSRSARSTGSAPSSSRIPSRDLPLMYSMTR